MTSDVSPLTLIAWAWAIWLAGWMLAAPWSRRTVRRQGVLARTAYVALVTSGCVLMYLHWGSPGHGVRPQDPPSMLRAWAGLAVVLAGLGFSVWARAHLGRLWSGTITIKDGHTIVRTGPYAVTRHPIYTGIVGALAGSALASGTWGAVAGFLLVGAGFLVKSSQEERWLAAHFGPEYEEYRRRTKRLVPFLW